MITHIKCNIFQDNLARLIWCNLHARPRERFAHLGRQILVRPSRFYKNVAKYLAYARYLVRICKSAQNNSCKIGPSSCAYLAGTGKLFCL